MNLTLPPQRKSKITNNIITNNRKSEFTAGGNPAMDKHPIHGGEEILPVA